MTIKIEITLDLPDVFRPMGADALKEMIMLDGDLKKWVKLYGYMEHLLVKGLTPYEAADHFAHSGETWTGAYDFTLEHLIPCIQSNLKNNITL